MSKKIERTPHEGEPEITPALDILREMIDAVGERVPGMLIPETKIIDDRQQILENGEALPDQLPTEKPGEEKPQA